MDEMAIYKTIEITKYSKFTIKPIYYRPFDDRIFYVYSGKKRICHISFLNGNYCYMNDCIDGAHWTCSINYSDMADLRKQVIDAAAEVEPIALNYLRLLKRYPSPRSTSGFWDLESY